MEGTMKVAVMTGKKKMEWCEREIPQPGPGELRIKLAQVCLKCLARVLASRIPFPLQRK